MKNHDALAGYSASLTEKMKKRTDKIALGLIAGLLPW